jgi:hypothetical protein
MASVVLRLVLGIPITSESDLDVVHAGIAFLKSSPGAASSDYYAVVEEPWVKDMLCGLFHNEQCAQQLKAAFLEHVTFEMMRADTGKGHVFEKIVGLGLENWSKKWGGLTVDEVVALLINSGL